MNNPLAALMQHRAAVQQPVKPAKHVFICRRCLGLVRKAYGLIKQFVVIHRSSMSKGGGVFHSYFPMAVNAFIFAVFSLSTPHNKVERR